MAVPCGAGKFSQIGPPAVGDGVIESVVVGAVVTVAMAEMAAEGRGLGGTGVVGVLQAASQMRPKKNTARVFRMLENRRLEKKFALPCMVPL